MIVSIILSCSDDENKSLNTYDELAFSTVYYDEYELCVYSAVVFNHYDLSFIFLEEKNIQGKAKDKTGFEKLFSIRIF